MSESGGNLGETKLSHSSSDAKSESPEQGPGILTSFLCIKILPSKYYTQKKPKDRMLLERIEIKHDAEFFLGSSDGRSVINL